MSGNFQEDFHFLLKNLNDKKFGLILFIQNAKIKTCNKNFIFKK